MPAVAKQTHEALGGIAAGRDEALAAMLERHGAQFDANEFDARTSALVKIVALIALDGPPASYAGQVAGAVESGVSAEEIFGALRAVAPLVGTPRTVAAAAEILLALGLTLPEGPGLGEQGE